jgi:peptidoglycan/LPS O-acetylase OafA/YrhL
MAAITALDRTAPATARVGRTRVISVAGAALAAVAVWAVAALLGSHLLIRFGDGAPQTVGLGLVAGSSLVASLFAWALLAGLERRTSRARTIWTAVALVVLLVSLSLPLTAGTTMSTKAALALMHVVAAAVLILGLRRG